MRRQLSLGEVLAFAAVPAALAAGGITIATFELSGHPGAGIWSNAWTWFAVILGGIALLIASVAPILAIVHDRMANASGQQAKNEPAITAEEYGEKVDVRPRVLPSTDRPFRTVRTTATVHAPRHRVATDAGMPPIVERLELALAHGVIRSVRKTLGKPSAQVELTLPPERMLDDYHTALGLAAALTGPPDEVTAGRIHQLVTPLQKMLVQAVPEPASRRMATEGNGAAAELAAIELTLTDPQLERYPWELIADPTLCAGLRPITVWRSVLSPMDPPVRKRWTSNLLLTGRPTGPDELTLIKGELSDYSQIRVFDRRGIPPSFRPLLEEHLPAAFHMVADKGILGDLMIRPESLGVDLGQSGVWVAVVSCRDSAAVPSGESRPPAYEIAQRSGAATIGMAGLTQPDMSGLFAAAFYRCLAQGFSALQGYHAAVRSVRDHAIYSTMWSIPVMYARTPNVIPFPIDDQVRVRLGLDQVRFHVAVLDRELEDLEERDFRSAGEWASHAATPIVRTDCISEYLAEVKVPRSAALPDGRNNEINDARDELQSALSETADSLTLLSDYKAGAPDRQRVLSRLKLHRIRHQRILKKLDGLIGEAR